VRIADSSLQLDASHALAQQRETSESLRMWSGQRPDFESAGAGGRVRLSDAGRAALEADKASLADGIDPTADDPSLTLIRFLLARLTGREMEVFNAASLGAAQAAALADAGFGAEYERHESYTEAEQTDFSASGIVRTADGKTIGFNLSISMSRYHHEESDVSLRLGNARATCDPLVINFSGTAAQLSDRRFSFDLDADGEASEQINFLARGSGFLAFDRDGDGKINDGSELFGARTGNGFAELASLDDDGNGWIDENDAAYEKLSVWVKDASGADVLYSLKEAKVGAIGLANAATPFSLKDGNNALLGEVRASGIWLREDGSGVGSIQQIDLTV
jgi:hypothetical protein